MNSDIDMVPVQLLDLPPGWLAWLILALEETAGLQALSSTCHKLHDLVLSHAALVPRLRIEAMQDQGAPLHVLALAMAEAATANLHVMISVSVTAWAARNGPNLLRPRWVDIYTRAASLHAQRNGMAPQLAPVPYQLQCVTRVTLRGFNYDDRLQLDSLIPDFLVQGCPNLRELTLAWVTIVAASPAAPPPPTCTSLQKLISRQIYFPDDAPSAAFKQQLLDLPSLTSLNIEGDHEPDFLAGGMYRAAIDRYSSQLKELEVVGMWYIPWSPGTQFPHLQHLDLPDSNVDSDEAMQQLMQAAPSLVRIQLHSISGLKTSFAQQPCSWQELTLGQVYVDQLAKLPLASCTRLVCDEDICLSSKGGPKPTPEQVAAGVAAVQAAGGLQFSDSVDVRLFSDDLQLIPAAGALLGQYRERASVTVLQPDTDMYAPWSDWQPVLAALGQHLTCNVLAVVWIAWGGSPGAFAKVPQLLPGVHGFDCPVAPVADVLQLCRTATRPFTLRYGFMTSGLKQQLEQAMQEAGHQLVTLQPVT